jgi:mycofactocin precursor
MTQQAVIEATPAQPAPSGGETADRVTAGRDPAGRDPAGRDPAGRDPADRDTGMGHPGDEALIADELLVEEVSIDGMCGVY